MIESRLDSLTDGIGGAIDDGDLTIAQIAEEFRYLATEGRARSVSAVLRIVKEQAKGRSQHAQFSVFAAVVACVFLAIALLFAISPDPHVRARTGNTVFGVLLWIVPCALLALKDRSQARRSRAQLDELRRLALETLGMIVGRPGFVPKPLDREQRKLFSSLRQTDPEGWLQVAEALAEEPA